MWFPFFVQENLSVAGAGRLMKVKKRKFRTMPPIDRAAASLAGAVRRF
jgi:hypothetical protein